MAVKARGKDRERKVPLRDIIEEEAKDAEREAMGEDERFDPDRDLGADYHGPGAFAHNMRDKDQMVIDELLAGLPKNQGYYLKLYKEIMPGKYELKEKIDQYDTWTDMELEVSERVKAMTRKFGSAKWGSALYRVIIWRNGGIREKNKYPPIDVIVDAGDLADAAGNMHTGKVDPMEAANEQMNALGNMLKAVETIMPRAVDPNIQFQAIVQAFTAGKGEKAQNEMTSTQMMMAMMTTMMTGMMETMKTAMAPRPDVNAAKPFEEQMANMMNIMKGFGFGAPAAPKGLVEQMAEMKLLGFDPFKREDTIEQIAKLKAMTGALVDVMPQGQNVERPGIFEKLIDALAPHVPKIFADLKSITDNAALAQKMQAIRLAQQPEPVPMDQRPTTSYGQPVGPQPDRMGAGDAFHQPPEMDPYSGFQTRPFPRPQEGDAGVEMFGSVEGVTPEELHARATGKPIPQTVKQPVPGVGQQQQPQPQSQRPVELPPMLQQLWSIIDMNMVHAYGALYETLMSAEESAQMIHAVQSKLIDATFMANELQKTGYVQFNHPSFVTKMHTYLEGFVTWIREQTIGKANAECPTCGAMHIFENVYEFSKGDHTCGAETSGTGQCQGSLQLKAQVPHVETVQT